MRRFVTEADFLDTVEKFVMVKACGRAHVRVPVGERAPARTRDFGLY